MPVGRPCRGPCHTLTISPLVMNDGLVALQAPASALFHAQSHAHNLMPFCHAHFLFFRKYSSTCVCLLLYQAESRIDREMFLHQRAVDRTCIPVSSGIMS